MTDVPLIPQDLPSAEQPAPSKEKVLHIKLTRATLSTSVLVILAVIVTVQAVKMNNHIESTKVKTSVAATTSAATTTSAAPAAASSQPAQGGTTSSLPSQVGGC